MNLGIVGAGLIVKELLSVSHKIKGITMTALLSRPESIQKNQALCDTYQIQHIYIDYLAMLDNSSIDTIYVAVPNHLHFDYCLKALASGKHVICEKPFTITSKEAIALKEAALKYDRMILEAISTIHLQNFIAIKEALLSKAIGDVKIITCNFSKISSRYKEFKSGIILPAFDPKMYGGALLDLNCYNLHFIVGIYGQPLHMYHYPNMNNGVDTSGIVILRYPDFTCNCIAAKDSNARIGIEIQGDQGSIIVDSHSSLIDAYSVFDAQGDIHIHNKNLHEHRMVNTFIQLNKIIQNNDYEQCHGLLDHSIRVVKLLEEARHQSY